MAQLTINTDWCSKKELSVCVAGFSQEELEIRYLTELSLEKTIKNSKKPPALFVDKTYLQNPDNINILADFIYIKNDFS